MLLVIVVACTTHFLFSPTGFVVEGNFHCRVTPNSSEDIAVIFLVVFTQGQDLEGLKIRACLSGEGYGVRPGFKLLLLFDGCSGLALIRMFVR